MGCLGLLVFVISVSCRVECVWGLGNVLVVWMGMGGGLGEIVLLSVRLGTIL